MTNFPNWLHKSILELDRWSHNDKIGRQFPAARMVRKAELVLFNKNRIVARYYCISSSAVWVTMKICDKCTNCELTLKPNIQSTELTSHSPQISMISISYFREVQSQYHSAVRSRAINMPPSIARHILASHNLLTRCWRANISPEHMISSPESHNFHLQTCSPMGPGRISPTLCLLIWPTSAQQGKKFSLPNYLVWVACHCVTKYPPS